MQSLRLKKIKSVSKYLILIAAMLVFISFLLNTPDGLLGKADAIGYAVCHRISERSFHVGELQLPLCARCSGMYLAAMVGVAYQTFFGRKRSGIPNWRILIPLALFVVAFGLDGANSYLYLIKGNTHNLQNVPNLYVPNNTLRLLTGSGMGLAVAIVIYPAFNSTVWADIDERQPIPNLKSLGILMGIILLLDLLILTERPFVLLPLEFISAGGVLVLLTLVYSLIWIMLMHQENTFNSLTQMWLPLIAGLTIAFIQILSIDMFRFWLTGTWGAPILGS